MDVLFIVIIAIVVAVILLFVAFHFGKVVFRLTLSLLFLIFVAVLVYGLVIFSDNLDVKTSFEKESNLFLVVHDERVVSAVFLKPFDDTIGFTTSESGINRYDKFFMTLSESQALGYTNYYKENKLEDLAAKLKLDRIFLIHTSAFFEVEGVLLTIDGVDITIADAGLAMESDDPIGVLAIKMADRSGRAVESVRPLVANALGNAKTSLQIVFMAKITSGDLASLNSFIPLFKLEGFEAYPDSSFFNMFHSESNLFESIMLNEKGEKIVDNK